MPILGDLFRNNQLNQANLQNTLLDPRVSDDLSRIIAIYGANRGEVKGVIDLAAYIRNRSIDAVGTALIGQPFRGLVGGVDRVVRDPSLPTIAGEVLRRLQDGGGESSFDVGEAERNFVRILDQDSHGTGTPPQGIQSTIPQDRPGTGTSFNGIHGVIPDPERPDDINNYARSLLESQRKISQFPFKGFYEKNLMGMSLHSNHLWDIQIAPHLYEGITYAPPLPKRYDDWLPAVSFELQDASLNTSTIDLYANSNFDIPIGRNISKDISINVVEDGDQSFFKYRAQYLENCVRRDGTAAPYKNACSKITIWIFQTEANILLKRVYLGILKDISLTIEGSDVPSSVTYPLVYSIVGEDLESNEIDLNYYRYIGDNEQDSPIPIIR